MYSDGLRKFLVLQWKSLLQKKRHWILTLLEIVIPSILFIAVVVLRYQAEEFSPKQIEAEERTVENFGKAEGEEHSKRIVLKGAFTFDAQFSGAKLSAGKAVKSYEYVCEYFKTIRDFRDSTDLTNKVPSSPALTIRFSRTRRRPSPRRTARSC